MMKPLQVLLDEELLSDLDEEARHAGTNRSKVVREALGRYLKEAQRRRLEEAHRVAYEKRPQQPDEYLPWQEVQSWPED